MSDVRTLLDFCRDLERATTLEEMLHRLVERASSMLGVARVSVRLLDQSGGRLLVSARVGEPLHTADGVTLDFAPGEGLVGWIALHAKPARVERVGKDERWVDRPGMTDPIEAFLGVPLLHGVSCIGVLSAVDLAPGKFNDKDETVLTLLASIASPYLRMARLRRLAQIDPVTFALNQRGLDEAYPEAATSMSTGAVAGGIAVALVDLDEFDQLNQRYGLAVGDQTLAAVAQILRRVVRRGDSLVRDAGDEFLVLLPGAGLTEAARIAERARSAVEGHLFTVGDMSYHLTVSIGVAERGADERREQLVQRASDAMFVAKKRGRNRVGIAR